MNSEQLESNTQEASTAKPQPGEFMKLVMAYKPATWLIVTAVVLGLGETALSLVIPLLTMNMVDQLAAANLGAATISLLVAVFVTQTAMSGFSVYTMSYIGQYIVAGLRKDLWKHVLRLPVPFFDRNKSGETMSRLTSDTNVIKDFIIGHVISFASGVLSVIGAVVLLLMIDWKMTLFMLLGVPAALLILWPLGSRMFAVSRTMQDETAHFQGDLGRVLTEIRLVKSSLAEHAEHEQGRRRIGKLFDYGLREARIMAVVTPMMMSVMLLVLVLLIGYGGVRVAEGTLTGGELVGIILYMFQIVMPFTQMASFFTQFQKALGASARITEIMREQPEATTGTGEAEGAGETAGTGEPAESEPAPRAAKAAAGGQQLVFERVGFGYADDRPILADVSFVAEAGQMTAFVGPSGTGKTTLFSLVERFYEPQRGQLVYGTTAVQDIPLTDWRGRIAYVSQESPVMAGTLRDNLAYGLAAAPDDAALDEAVRQACLDEYLASLPEGYDTEVGERGVKLSGGQRQRLAIARAILRDPDMLLLDEATAHLDSDSEHIVQRALQALMANRTTLVIAHRLSTIRNADKIVVLEQGSISGQGSHEELLATNTLYAKLVRQQFERE